MAVQAAKTAGVRTLMITGDHQITAATIAAELGIVEKGAHAVTGAELQKMDAEQLRESVRNHSVFTRAWLRNTSYALCPRYRTKAT